MFLVLTKTVGKKPNLQRDTVHDWSSRLVRTYSIQWGPPETWCRIIDETEAENLAKGLSAPSVDATPEPPKAKAAPKVKAEKKAPVVAVSEDDDELVPSLDGPDETTEEEKELV